MRLGALCEQDLAEDRGGSVRPLRENRESEGTPARLRTEPRGPRGGIGPGPPSLRTDRLMSEGREVAELLLSHGTPGGSSHLRPSLAPGPAQCSGPSYSPVAGASLLYSVSRAWPDAWPEGSQLLLNESIAPTEIRAAVTGLAPALPPSPSLLPSWVPSLVPGWEQHKTGGGCLRTCSASPQLAGAAGEGRSWSCCP